MDRWQLFTVVLLVAATACEPMRSSGRGAPVEPPERESTQATETRVDEAEHEPEPGPRLAEDQRHDAKIERAHAPGVPDRGVFTDLDGEVRLSFPDWLANRAVPTVHWGSRNVLAYVDGRAVGYGIYDDDALREVGDSTANDADGDGIPNQLDILIGAKKTALNAAPYKGGYQGLDYPGGDVPRTEGVCTDVIIRAVRNAGIDLQEDLHEDIKRAPAAYPMVDTPDPNIDQRRVKTLLPFFERRWEARSTDVDEESDWLPGDIVFFNTMRDERPDHVGIVSDELSESGRPLIINNWTNGYHTQAMDLLRFVPVTHRFRLPADEVDLVEPGDVTRTLARFGVAPMMKHRTMVFVQADRDGPDATLRRMERDETGRWKQVGDIVSARVGRAGLGLGIGLQQPVRTGLMPKVEGDGKAPAGVFDVGTAFGAGEKPFEGPWPWRVADEHARWVDDSDSEEYNTWKKAGEGDWSSAERLSNYNLALVVEHNLPVREPGAGSAIFVHDWSLDYGGTLGCTGIERDQMMELLAWLDLESKPILVQLPD